MKACDRIGIIEQVTETNVNGSISSAWTTVVSYPFYLETNQGTETKNGGGIESVATMIVSGRYYPGLNTKMRMNIGGQYWNITAIDEFGRNERLRITMRKND